MLVTQGEARDGGIDRRLAAVLAAIAGAVNVAAFQAVGFFAANMTGNVSAASNLTALGQLRLAGFYALIVLTFVGGAAVSTLLVNMGRRRQMAEIYALSILAEAVLMALLAAWELVFPSVERGPILVLGLSFLMGLQNAVVTRISNARVRTTHISGMATDIGIELGMLFDIGRRREPGTDRHTVLSNLRLHGMTVLSFFAGGFVGALLYRSIGTYLFLGCATLLLMVALPQAIRARGLADNPS